MISILYSQHHRYLPPTLSTISGIFIATVASNFLSSLVRRPGLAPYVLLQALQVVFGFLFSYQETRSCCWITRAMFGKFSFLFVSGLLVSAWSYYVETNQRYSRRTWELTASTKTVPAIEGLMEQDEFDRLDAIDKTVQALCEQLPSLLTKPLTTQTASQAYSGENFRLSVQVNVSDASNVPKDFVVLQGQNDWIALSDVLVLGTAAAQQANKAISGGSADTTVEVTCQIILDDSYRILRIPWKATTPLLGSPKSNNFEGITDCFLSEAPSDLGKVERFVIRKLTWNGRSLNGPAIGKALKTVQSTVANLQQSPLLRNLIGSTENRDRTTSFLNSLRDGFLDQAANVISTQRPASQNEEDNGDESRPVQVICSGSVVNSDWIDESGFLQSTSNSSIARVPCPGTDEWEYYRESRKQLTQFCETVLPLLSDLSIVDPKLFSENATYQADDGTVLMTGRERLANYYQSLALTRKATGSSWSLTRCKVTDWRERHILVEYTATVNGLPQWKIQGGDTFTLTGNAARNGERETIARIKQHKMALVYRDGSETALDGLWLTKNLANAFDREESGKASRDFLTELLMQQPGMGALLKKSNSGDAKSKKKVSQAAAAKCYYIMADLWDHSVAIFDVSSSRITPPASEHMEDNIELRGYLGESILKGKSLYDRSLGSVVFGVRDSIRQNRIAVEKVFPSRVELLMPSGDIRLFQKFSFRIPTPGAGIILPENVSSPPIRLELVSDYKVDPATGMIMEHRLVETRVNGQLTPGDQVSRWIQRFLNGDDGPIGLGENGATNDNIIKAIIDTMKFFRTATGEDSK